MTALRRFLIGIMLLTAGFVLGGYSQSVWEGWRQPDRCWEATVYLPLTGNDGKRFTEEQMQDAVGALAARFGGATAGEPREGYWLDGQQQVRREPVRPVTVSFARARLTDFRTTVRDIGRRLGQECMYVRLEEPRVELVPVPADGATTAP